MPHVLKCKFCDYINPDERQFTLLSHIRSKHLAQWKVVQGQLGKLDRKIQSLENMTDLDFNVLNNERR